MEKLLFFLFAATVVSHGLADLHTLKYMGNEGGFYDIFCSIEWSGVQSLFVVSIDSASTNLNEEMSNAYSMLRGKVKDSADESDEFTLVRILTGTATKASKVIKNEDKDTGVRVTLDNETGLIQIHGLNLENILDSEAEAYVSKTFMFIASAKEVTSEVKINTVKNKPQTRKSVRSNSFLFKKKIGDSSRTRSLQTFKKNSAAEEGDDGKLKTNSGDKITTTPHSFTSLSNPPPNTFVKKLSNSLRRNSKDVKLYRTSGNDEK